ncbi:MAG: SBBP repeat-containing protein [Bacteroidales bacterium]
MKSIKLILIITINVIISMNSLSQTVAWDWSKSGGGSSDDSGYCITTDFDGNVIIGGSFNSTAFFDDLQLTAMTYWGGGYIAKYDSLGSIIWLRKITGTRTSAVHAITCDIFNNIYITGHFTETTYIDTISLTSNGSSDLFIGKYDVNGNLVWIKSAGGIDLDAGMSITCSESFVYVAGEFRDSIYFDSTLLISNGNSDIFLACLDFDGNYEWVVQAGSSDYDVARSVCIDSFSNVIIAGLVNTNAYFNASDSSVITNGSYDVFVAKYLPTGGLQWVNSFGGIDRDRGISVISDPNNNLFLHGHFYGTAYFDGITLTSSGDEDYFICKLNPNGSIIWAKKIGATVYPLDDAWKKTIVNDEQGNVYVTSWFMDSLVYDDLTVQSNGSYDIFVMKIDTDGNLIWCLTAGNDHSYGDYSRSIARDSNGNLYITGRFYDSLFFGDSSVTSYGSADVFIAKIREEPVSVDKKKTSLEINVYPNPATDYINIGQTLQHIEKAEIIGINGDVLRSYDTDLDRLDVFGLAKGIYLLKLYAGNVTFVSKIVIQ